MYVANKLFIQYAITHFASNQIIMHQSAQFLHGLWYKQT